MSESGSDQDISTEPGRRRSKLPALTLREKDTLLLIVAKPAIKLVVENKATNAVWTAQKSAAWDKVSKEFCSNLDVVKRTGPQLKKAWENLKSRCKKKVQAIE